MPQLITSQSQNALGGMGLTIVRLFVHPAIWSVMLFFFRVVTRHLGKKDNPREKNVHANSIDFAIATHCYMCIMLKAKIDNLLFYSI